MRVRVYNIFTGHSPLARRRAGLVGPIAGIGLLLTTEKVTDFLNWEPHLHQVFPDLCLKCTGRLPRKLG